MKLQEAIGINQVILDVSEPWAEPDEKKAPELGIEALKHVQNERAVGGFGREVTLPGLTEE